MSVVVCHGEKYHNVDIRGIQNEVLRKGRFATKENVIQEKTKDNIDLCNENHKLVDRSFEKMVNQKIQDLGVTRKVKDSAVKMINVIISSDADFFSHLSRDDSVQFFETAKKYFDNDVGADRIFSAVVHFDEATPHMHLSFVPVTEDHRLSAKLIFNPIRLKTWQRELPIHLRKHGFDIERGVEGSAKKHLDEVQFKVKCLEEKAKTLDEQIQSKTSAVSELDEKIQKTQISLTSVELNLRKSKDELKDLDVKKADVSADIRIFQKELQECANRLDQVQDQHSQAVIELQSINTSIQSGEKIIESMKNILSDLREERSQFQMNFTAEKEGLDFKTKKAQSLLQRARASLEELRSDKTILISEISKIDYEKRELSRDVYSLKSTIQTEMKELERIQAEKPPLNAEIDDLKAQKTIFDTDTQSAEYKLELLNLAISRNQDLNKKILTQRENIYDYHNELDQTDRSVNDLLRILDNCKRDIGRKYPSYETRLPEDLVKLANTKPGIFTPDRKKEKIVEAQTEIFQREKKVDQRDTEFTAVDQMKEKIEQTQEKLEEKLNHGLAIEQPWDGWEDEWER